MMAKRRGAQLARRSAVACALMLGWMQAAQGQTSSFSDEERLEIERIVQKVIVERMTGAAKQGPVTLIDASDPERVVAIARKYGKAELKRLDNAPVLTGEIEGRNYEIIFYGCESSGRSCKNLQMIAFWAENGASQDSVMRWNREKRFGKAFLDPKGRLFLEMNVNIDYGVTEKNLADTFDWWGQLLAQFVTFFKLS